MLFPCGNTGIAGVSIFLLLLFKLLLTHYGVSGHVMTSGTVLILACREGERVDIMAAKTRLTKRGQKQQPYHTSSISEKELMTAVKGHCPDGSGCVLKVCDIIDRTQCTDGLMVLSVKYRCLKGQKGSAYKKPPVRNARKVFRKVPDYYDEYVFEKPRFASRNAKDPRTKGYYDDSVAQNDYVDYDGGAPSRTSNLATGKGRRNSVGPADGTAARVIQETKIIRKYLPADNEALQKGYCDSSGDCGDLARTGHRGNKAEPKKPKPSMSEQELEKASKTSFAEAAGEAGVKKGGGGEWDADGQMLLDSHAYWDADAKPRRRKRHTKDGLIVKHLVKRSAKKKRGRKRSKKKKKSAKSKSNKKDKKKGIKKNKQKRNKKKEGPRKSTKLKTSKKGSKESKKKTSKNKKPQKGPGKKTKRWQKEKAQKTRSEKASE